MLDLIFAATVIVLGMKGIIKNDITERKEQADLIKAKRMKIQAEIDQRSDGEVQPTSINTINGLE